MTTKGEPEKKEFNEMTEVELFVCISALGCIMANTKDDATTRHLHEEYVRAVTQVSRFGIDPFKAEEYMTWYRKWDAFVLRARIYTIGNYDTSNMILELGNLHSQNKCKPVLVS